MSETRTDSQPLPEPPRPRGAGQTAWVGVFLILGLVAVLGSLFVFTDAAVFRGRYVITALVDDAGGIRRGDPVQMRGVNIGRVQRFRISPEGVAIRLEIEGEYEIPRDSRLELRSAGFLGGLAAVVVPGTATELLGYGDSIAGSKEEGLMQTADRLASRTEEALLRVQELVDPETTTNVRRSTGELVELLGELRTLIAEQRDDVAKLVASLRRTSEGVEKAAAGPELERSVKRLDALSERMDDVLASLDRSSRSLESVLDRVERGEGTLGRLSKDEALYENLNQAASDMSATLANLNELAADIRKDPKRYLHLSLF